VTADETGWANLLQARAGDGEDVDDAAYLAVLEGVWATRAERVRGFMGIPGALVGECGVCYRPGAGEVPLAYVCVGCAAKHPGLADKAGVPVLPCSAAQRNSQS